MGHERSSATSLEDPVWSWPRRPKRGEPRVIAQKRHLENCHVRIKFMVSEMKIRHGRPRRRPVATATERISREPRLTGGVPLGTFRSSSTANQIEVAGANSEILERVAPEFRLIQGSENARSRTTAGQSGVSGW